MSNLIGFVGFKGSGKSEAARFINKEYGWQVYSMAGPLKEMLITMGLKHEQVYGKDKEKPSDLLCGNLPRYGMQTLGNEWGRHLIGRDIWVNVMEAKINEFFLNRKIHLLTDVGICIEDIRFPNEFGMIEKLNGSLVKIEREGCNSDGHESESYVTNLSADITITNNGTLEEFYKDLRETYDLICGRPTNFR